MLHTPQLNQSVPNRFEQRDSYRVSNPVLQVEIDGTYYTTVNWSLNGLLIDGLIKGVDLDSDVSGTFGPNQSPEICRFAGRIVRIDLKSKQMAIELDGCSKEVAALLPFWVLKYGTK
ncbi:hypothetical protein [Sneathiella limimaris]|uniref:hypothetical protein n=1 Tax=Sneathiella limimaris TaxID=1964213 RepID=UPI00146F5050|nr:hypothetical protein [Sneathiella limimaris]